LRRKNLAKDCRVLVVEDDPAIRMMVSDALGLEGYSVETAVNGADALRRIPSLLPAVVVLDMRMPVLDGWGFARECRARFDRRAAILVMTAAQDAARWAREIDAEGFVSKPFELDDLLSAVARLCPR
jgi:CheY-like chemotaxis protein